MSVRRRLTAFAACAFLFAVAAAAADPSSSKAAPEPYAAAEFPQWTLDLRRGEAVSFGVLPFTLFLSTFAMDTFRYYQNDWNRAYAPWPLKPSGAVSMTESEFQTTFAAACAGAVVVAAIDFAIVAIKRHSKRKAVESKPKPTFSVERAPAPAEKR